MGNGNGSPIDVDMEVKATKGLRLQLDGALQNLRAVAITRSSRERSLAITKLQEAIMWLGMDLKAMFGGVSCYKEGYNPESSVVEPTADGLRM